VEADLRNDFDAMERLRHPAWRLDWPQSGERITSSEAYRAIHQSYPGGLPSGEVERLVGSEDRYVVGPSFTITRVAGSGDFWFGHGHITYPDGTPYHIVTFLELRDGKVYRETEFFAAPFEAPDWRAEWVERVSDPHA
jgi:hypothetical protein